MRTTVQKAWHSNKSVDHFEIIPSTVNQYKYLSVVQRDGRCQEILYQKYIFELRQAKYKSLNFLIAFSFVSYICDLTVTLQYMKSVQNPKLPFGTFCWLRFGILYFFASNMFKY
jgi:hypothetical protein